MSNKVAPMHKSRHREPTQKTRISYLTQINESTGNKLLGANFNGTPLEGCIIEYKIPLKATLGILITGVAEITESDIRDELEQNIRHVRYTLGLVKRMINLDNILLTCV